jgi:hypothetical protein
MGVGLTTGAGLAGGGVATAGLTGEGTGLAEDGAATGGLAILAFLTGFFMRAGLGPGDGTTTGAGSIRGVGLGVGRSTLGGAGR